MGTVVSQPAHAGTPRSPARAPRRDESSPHELAGEASSALWALPLEERYRKLEDYYELEVNPAFALGKGHYGVVRRGRRLADGVAVAIKTVRKRQPLYVDMLRNEIGILKGLRHPNVIALIDTFETSVDVHLVFELCAGELFEPIADSGFCFTETQVARLIQALLLALQECKRQRIVHRDIKPENILLVSPGVESSPRLIDFGLASRLEPGQTLTRHVGTPYYCAPEVLQQRGYTEQCDMWSLGVVTFTMLCGYPPFWGDTERDIYRRIRRGTYSFEGPEWESRSQAALDFVTRVLVGDPAARLTVEDALQHPWITHEGDVPNLDPPSLFTALARHAARPALWRLVALALAECALRQDWPPQGGYTFDASSDEEEGPADFGGGGSDDEDDDEGEGSDDETGAGEASTGAVLPGSVPNGNGAAPANGVRSAAAPKAPACSPTSSSRLGGLKKKVAAALGSKGGAKKQREKRQTRPTPPRPPRPSSRSTATGPAAVPRDISSLLTDHAVRAFEVLVAHTDAAARAAASLSSAASDVASQDGSSSAPSVSFALQPPPSGGGQVALKPQTSSTSEVSSLTSGTGGFSSSTGSWSGYSKKSSSGGACLGAYRVSEAAFCGASWTPGSGGSGQGAGKEEGSVSTRNLGAVPPKTPATDRPAAPSSSSSSGSTVPSPLGQPDAKLVFRAVDVAGSNSLGIVEVVAALLPLSLVRRYPNVILRAFDRLDSDGDGLLSIADLCSVCHVRKGRKRFAKGASGRESSSSRSRSRSSSRGSSVGSSRSGGGGSGEIGGGGGAGCNGSGSSGTLPTLPGRGSTKGSEGVSAHGSRRSPSPPPRTSRGRSRRRSGVHRMPPIVTLALHESDADGDGTLTLADVLALM